VTAGKTRIPKYKVFFSSDTSLFTKLAVLSLLMHFILTSPQKIYFPEYFEIYFSDLGDVNILGLLSLILTSLAWLSTLAVALLTIFGRKNLGFLFALGLALLSVVVFFLAGGLDLDWILANYLDIEPVGIVFLISTFVILPLGLILLVLGRPEVRRLANPKA